MALATLDSSPRFASLLESLSTAEKECSKFRMKSTIPPIDRIDRNQMIIDNSPKIDRKCMNKMQRFRGKDSIFKRPDVPDRRSSSTHIPDHHKNPHKWTKYSLADVSNEEMSDKSNTQAALSFLKAFKSRKQIRTNTHHEDDSMEVEKVTDQVEMKSKRKASSTIRFRKPINDDVNTDTCLDPCSSASKPIFKSSTLVMPEYVIGQKLKKKSHKKTNNVSERTNRSGQVPLNHLQELDEEA